MHLRDFVSKTVLKPESCIPCGKRIRLGKLFTKYCDCCVVSHPHCQDHCPLPCISTLIGTSVKIGKGMLAYSVSQTSPVILSVFVHWTNESEWRVLTKTGLYQISRSDLTVKIWKRNFKEWKLYPSSAKRMTSMLCVASWKTSFESSNNPSWPFG